MKRRNHRPIGRPSTIAKPQVQKRICVLVQQGAPPEHAAAIVGVSRSPFYAFQAENQDFQDMVQKARAKFLLGHIQNVNRAAKQGNWQASMTMLERRDPENYARADRHFVKLHADVGDLPTAYIKRIQEALGVRGELIPIGPALLGSGNGHEAIDTDALPQE